MANQNPAAPLTDRQIILSEINQERDRQLAKWGEQHHPDDTGGDFLATAAHNARNACQQAAKHIPGGPGWRLILEEEVAEAFAENDRVRLRDELIQVAAVAVAWIEDIHTRGSDEPFGIRIGPDGVVVTGSSQPAIPQEPAPHVVIVTQLPGGFDLNDRKPHEQLIGNGVAGWVSHQVQHPDACHQLPYGQLCRFDDEWENGQYTYDDIPPGLYHVQARAHDVGDHNGEYSHTEGYLDYQRIGDAPERATSTSAEPGPGYSDGVPF